MTTEKKKLRRHEEFQSALNRAHAAAAQACEKEQDHPERLDCGFAWCVVLDRSFMGWCRRERERCLAKAAEFKHGTVEYSAWNQSANKYGDKHHAAGWCFWKPGGFNGQSVTGHEAGAKAFRDSLAQSLGIYVETGSRLD